MMRGDFVEHRYSDEELRRILEDATRAELHPRSPSRMRQGYTLAEIRQIAEEAGIDLEEVDRAAANLVASEEGARLPTGRTKLSRVIHEEMVIPRPLTNAEMRLVALQAERVLGRQGTLRDTGPWVEWLDGKNQLYVGVVRGRDQTRLRVITDQAGALRVSAGIGLIGLLSLPGAGSLDPMQAVAAVGVILIVTYGIIRWYWKWRCDVTRGHLQDLLEILADAVPT